MLDKLKVTAKNSVIYSLGNFATKLTGLLLLPIYTSEFSVEEYGVLGLLEVSTQILVAIFGLNLFNAFFRWYWDKKYAEKQKSLLYTVLIVVINTAFVLTGLFAILSEPLAKLVLGSETYKMLLIITIASAALESIGIIPATLMRLEGKAFKYTLSYLLKLLINVVLNIFLILFLNKGIISIYISSFAGNIAYLVVLSPYLLKNIEFKFEKQILGAMLKFCLPLLLSAITGIILTITDRYALRYLTGLDAVGTYSLGFKLANVIRFLLIIPINLAVLPIFYKIIGEPGNRDFYAKFTTYYSLVVVWAILGISLFADIVVFVFAKDQSYWDSILVVPILAFSTFFGMLKDMSLTGLNIKKKTGVISIIVIVLSAINLLLNIVLIPYLGIIGAAISTLTVQILYFVITYYYSQSYYNIPYELKRIAIIAICGVALFYAQKLIPEGKNFWPYLMRIFIFFSFPFLLYLMKLFQPKEILAFIGFYEKWKSPKRWKSNIGK